MLHATLTFAAEAVKDEPSKTAWYVLGSVLALYAVLLAAVGMSRSEAWPSSAAATRAVMGVSTILVVAAMAASVLTG